MTFPSARQNYSTVQPGHLGMIYNRFGGLDDKANLREGLNFVIPWFQRPIIYDIRTRPEVNCHILNAIIIKLFY